MQGSPLSKPHRFSLIKEIHISEAMHCFRSGFSIIVSPLSSAEDSYHHVLTERLRKSMQRLGSGKKIKRVGNSGFLGLPFTLPQFSLSLFFSKRSLCRGERCLS